MEGQNIEAIVMATGGQTVRLQIRYPSSPDCRAHSLHLFRFSSRYCPFFVRSCRVKHCKQLSIFTNSSSQNGMSIPLQPAPVAPRKRRRVFRVRRAPNNPSEKTTRLPSLPSPLQSEKKWRPRTHTRTRRRPQTTRRPSPCSTSAATAASPASRSATCCAPAARTPRWPRSATSSRASAQTVRADLQIDKRAHSGNTSRETVDFDAFSKVLNRPGGFRDPGQPEEYCRGFQVFDKDMTGFIGVGQLRYSMFRSFLGGATSETDTNKQSSPTSARR